MHHKYNNIIHKHMSSHKPTILSTSPLLWCLHMQSASENWYMVMSLPIKIKIKKNTENVGVQILHQSVWMLS